MSKALIVGIREYSFTDDSNGRLVEGASVYTKVPLQTENGLYGSGFTVGKLPLRKGSPLYDRMVRADYTKPFEAEIIYEYVPGKKTPELMDIKF